MKKYLRIFILLLLPVLVSAKSVETNQFGYGGTYNDLFNSVERTSDGGYIVVGSTISKQINEVSTGVGNGLVVKYDKDGNVVWNKFYGGSAHEEFYDVIVVSDGYVAVGYTMSTDIEGLTTNGGNDGLVVKFDNNGNIVWQTLIGGTGDDYIHAIREASNGNLVIVGRFASDIGESTNNGGLDAFIGMVDSTGKLIDSNLYGGDQDEAFYDIEIGNNGYYAVGYSKSDISNHTNIGLQDAILVRYDEDLADEWEVFYGNTKGDMYRSIKSTIDGGFIVAGFDTNSKNDTSLPLGTNGVLVKYDKNGNIEWSKVYGGSSSDSFEKVEQMKNGDYLVVGKGYSTDIEGVTNNGDQEAFIVLYNSNGEVLWHKWIGGTALDILTDVTILDNNEFVAVGYVHSSNVEGMNHKGGADGMVVKGNIHYVITELPTSNGTFDAYEENENGMIEISPEEGYKLDKISIKDTLDRSVTFNEDNGKYHFELYDDVTVEVLFRKDTVENPNTGDGFLTYILVVFGFMVMLLLVIRYFSKNMNVYEK